jgi:hypothetical protein
LPDDDYDAFMAWMKEGVDNKWVALPVCSTHDMVPLTPDEEAEWEMGYDPCIVTMRLWFGQ